MNDAELLAQFVRDRSEQAFAALVRRHVDWIYSTALRRVRNVHLAEDVTQATFTVLATRAHSLGRQKVLSAWLFHVVSNISSQALRQEARRRLHETRAAEHMQMTHHNVHDNNSREQWDQIEHLVDGLVGQLKQADREAVMLRFYEKRSFVEIGTLLGISEEAARKRVSRAIDKLRMLMGAQGEAISSDVLAGVLLAEMTKPAPVALSASISAGASSSLSKAAIAALSWAHIKLAAMAATLIVVVAGGTIAALLQLSPPAAATNPAPGAQIANGAARARELLVRYQQSLDALTRIHYRYREEARFEGDYNFDSVPKFKEITTGEFFRDGARASILYTLEFLDAPDRHQAATNLDHFIYGADNLPPDTYLSFQSYLDEPRDRWSVGVLRRSSSNDIFQDSGWGIVAGEASSETLPRLLADAPGLSVRDEKELVDGHESYVIDVQTKHGKHSIWIDPTAGYLARRIEVHKSDNDLEGSQPLNRPPPKPEPDGAYDFPYAVCKSWDFVVDHIGIERIGGTYVPVSAVTTETRKFVDGKVAILHAQSQREEVDLNPDFAAARCFTLDIPDGTRVSHFDKNKPDDPRFEWRAGKVVQIERLYGRAVRDGLPIRISWRAQLQPDGKPRASFNWLPEDIRADGLFSVSLTSSERELLMKNCADQLEIFDRSGTLGEVNISELSTDRDHPPQFTFPRK